LRVAVAGLGGLGEVRSGRGRGRLRRRGGRLLRLRGLLLGRGRVRLLPWGWRRAEARLLRGLVGRRGRVGHDGGASGKGRGGGRLGRRGGGLLRLRGRLLGRGRVRLLPGVMRRAESRLLRGLVGRRGRLGHDGNTSVKGTGDGEVTGRSEGAGRPGPALLTAVTRLTCRRRASTSPSIRHCRTAGWPR